MDDLRNRMSLVATMLIRKAKACQTEQFAHGTDPNSLVVWSRGEGYRLAALDILEALGDPEDQPPRRSV